MLAYQQEINEICQAGVQCPPTDAAAIRRQAWRFVFSPITAVDAQPVAVRNPKRLTNASDLEKCSAWALSMYASPSQGASAFQALERKFPRIKKLIGDHIAAVTISPADGLCTNVQHNGHFDFFAYGTTNVLSLMTVSAVL